MKTTKRIRKTLSSTAVLPVMVVIVIIVMFGVSVSPASAEDGVVTSYVGDNYGTADAGKTIKPSWSADMLAADPYYDMSEGAAAVDGKAYFINKKGELVSAAVQTGKQAWTFGNNLIQPPVYHDGRVYVSGSDGTLYAVNAKSGGKIWSSSVKQKGIRQLAFTTDQLFAISDRLQAYRLPDGKLQWKDNYEWPLSGGRFWIAGDMILEEHYESGAYTYSETLGIDRLTGKFKWKARDLGSPLRISSSDFLVQVPETLFEQPQLTTVQKVELKTGKILSAAEYNPENFKPAGEEGGRSVGRVSIAGDHIYISFG